MNTIVLCIEGLQAKLEKHRKDLRNWNRLISLTCQCLPDRSRSLRQPQINR